MNKKNTKIVPRHKYMLIKQDTNETKETEAGLLIPTNVEKEQKSYGTVYAVSSEIKDVKIGDKVVYGVYAGETVKIMENGKEVEYKLIHDEDVIAFLK